MLRRQPKLTFTSYWVTVPPEPVPDEKMACTLPPVTTQLLNEVKNEDDLGEFLQNKDKSDALKQEVVVKLIDPFYKKFQTLWQDDRETLDKIRVQQEELIKKFDYDGKGSVARGSYFAFYREGLPLFFNILHTVEQEPKSFSEDFLKTTMLYLFDQMDLCPPGILTRMNYAAMRLWPGTPEHELLKIRQEIAEKIILLKLRQHPIMQIDLIEPYEIHFFNSISNYLAKRFGLKKIEGDFYAMDLSEPNPYDPFTDDQYQWFIDLKQIADDIAPLLTRRAVFEQLAEKIAGEIRTFKKDSERDDKINALLDQYGSDDDFQIANNVIDMETGELQSWELFLQNIRITLFKRSATQNRITFPPKQIALTPTLTLHLFSDESFNYVVEAASYGSKPRAIPLSNYLLKAAEGYPVSLVQQDDSEKLQSELKKNAITPLALIKCGDRVETYGMVEGEPTLAEFKLHPSLIDWSQESTTLSNELYGIIAEHKAHDELSPLELLTRINEQLLLHSMTVLSGYDIKLISELPGNDKNRAKANTIYLSSAEEICIFRDPRGVVQTVSLEAGDGDIINLYIPHHLKDRALKELILKNISKNHTLLSLFTSKALSLLSKKGFSNIVLSLLRNWSITWNQKMELFFDGRSVFLMAVSWGHADLVRELMEFARLKCATDSVWIKRVFGPTSCGQTPLHLAAEYGHLSVVKTLISSALCPDILTTTSTCPLFSLAMLAQQNNTLSAMEEFLQNNEPDQEGLVKMTPIDIAKIMGHEEIVNYLSHQIWLAEKTSVYEYARRIHKYMSSAKEKGWIDFVNMLHSHKEAILDPLAEIENLVRTVADVLMQSLIRPFQQSMLASSSAFFGASDAEDRFKKILFIGDMQTAIKKLQDQIIWDISGISLNPPSPKRARVI